MNIVTIMNYAGSDNHVNMCNMFVDQVIKHNPGCVLSILYRDNVDGRVRDFCKPHNNIQFIKRPDSRESWNVHHNIKFKLYNLSMIREPFIYLDCDIACMSSLQHLWSIKDDKPFIGVNHQNIPGHVDKFNFKFLNSGVQIVGDPEWYEFDNFQNIARKINGRMRPPGWDQANIFEYCASIDYDYTHPLVGYGWNSCAQYGVMVRGDDDIWRCSYNGPGYSGEATEYPVYLNHYWWDFKPWNINCPLYSDFISKSS
jgi:hypothetical protein